MNGKTPISALQELMAARGVPLPIYVEEGSGTSFKCTVRAAGVTAIGYGTSKKTAKHESAKNALMKLKEDHKSSEIIILEQTSLPRVDNVFRNYVGDLNEYAAKFGAKYPNYDFITVSVNGDFFFKCSFLDKESMGKGMNKKDAKQDAARQMLELVKKNEPVLLRVHEKTTITLNNAGDIIQKYNRLTLNETKVTLSKTSQILEPTPGITLADEETIESLQNKLRLHNICYTLKQFQKEPCIMYVQINDTDLYFMHVGKNREEATRNVLQEVLNIKKSGCSLTTNDLLRFN
ncbi:uncharacterized protein LOC123005025 [Tribolium madens]|uniref:uncharacterized protein LOC123005025 n=1 Tax=Tribolium madens TaxID=41895 RepID=UPI001CF75EEF|nr:uncharacterized protein LOC123005025 [Tribolium madens]